MRYTSYPSPIYWARNHTSLSGSGPPPPPPLPVTNGLVYFTSTSYLNQSPASLMIKDGADKVSQWTAQEGTVPNAIQTLLPPSQPLYTVAGGSNATDFIRFNVANDNFMVMDTDTWWQNLVSHTCFIVYESITIPAAFNENLFGEAFDFTRWVIFHTSDGNLNYQLGSFPTFTTVISTTPFSAGQKGIITGRFSALADGGDGSFELFVDNISKGSGTFNLTPSSLATNAAIAIGAFVRNNKTTSLRPCNGNFFAILVYDRALSVGEQLSVSNYLKNIFGTP